MNDLDNLGFADIFEEMLLPRRDSGAGAFADWLTAVGLIGAPVDDDL
jgi:hypothetical protein